MRTASSKSSHHGNSHEKGHRHGNEMQMNMPLGGELLWWPYRSLARFMLPNCRSAVAALHIGRQLADEIRDVIRLEQDILFNQSEKFLRLTCEESNSRKATGTSFAPEAIEEFYDTTMSGVRELTRAMSDAQLRSLNAIREYPREADGTKGDDSDRKEAAA